MRPATQAVHLGVAGLAAWWRGGKRMVVLATTLAIFAMVGFFAMLTFYKGGVCWGPRYLTPIFGMLWLFAPDGAKLLSPSLVKLLLALGAAVNFFDVRNPDRGTEGLWNPEYAEQDFQIAVTDANGVTGTVEVVAVDQDVYMKFFTPTFNKIDPATYGAPNPAQLFNKDTGITALIARTQSLTKASTVRDGADVLNTFSGKLPGDAVADLLVVGDRKGTFDVTYGVTQTDKELRSVVIKGPFYAGATSTYTLHLTSLAKAVAITRP